MGLVDLFNGIDVQQTRHWIKISVKTYIERIMSKHLDTWMKTLSVPARPTPLPTKPSFLKDFLNATGDKDEKAQRALAKEMGFGYRNGIGELIYAMVTCRPDLSYGVVRCSQYSSNPHRLHYHGVRHMLKYLWMTRDDGIMYWRPTPRMDLPDVPPPRIQSNEHDLLHDGRPTHGPLEYHGYMDSDWAACPKTRRSMGGDDHRLAGGTIAYKTSLMKTIAQSSTEGEFMEATDFGKRCLYIRSILWDLGIPQCAATIAYEDNDAATAMANAQKPTPRARHMDIRFKVLCEWVERDLIKLERIDTTVNPADHFTKQLGGLLFRRHNDYIMGRVPPEYSSYFQSTMGKLPFHSETTRDNDAISDDSTTTHLDLGTNKIHPNLALISFLPRYLVFYWKCVRPKFPPKYLSTLTPYGLVHTVHIIMIPTHR